MAGSSLLALIDDIATLLDDIAVMSKVAAKKTAGVLGDDLALNAQQVMGVSADRELPIVWAVARGSLLNKAILVPAALLISALAPWAILPLLMLGGLYLCFEGAEKLAHRWFQDAHAEHEAHARELQVLADPAVDWVSFERDKIRGAVRTDFILSAEIIAITLGTVALAPFLQQVVVLSLVAVAMTVGVYGLVAGIVKLDDLGLYWSRRPQEAPLSGLLQPAGRLLLRAAPKLMRTLSVLGTVAMFLVGGGILVHGLPGSEDWLHALGHGVAQWPVVGGVLEPLVPVALQGLAGLVAGALVVVTLLVARRVLNPLRSR